MSDTTLLWDAGPAYDYFVSLRMLHEPKAWGLRPAWAAGVRARIPAGQRNFLGEVYDLLGVPVEWLQAGSLAGDTETMLQALQEIPPKERLFRLLFPVESPHTAQARSLLAGVSARADWQEPDLRALAADPYMQSTGYDEAYLRLLLAWAARAGTFGERLLPALRSYHEGFFVEEEARIRPYLRQALAAARALAGKSPLETLVAALTGIRWDRFPTLPSLTLIPSFWLSARVIWGRRQHDGGLFYLFAARPDDVSLVPGDPVPDALLAGLKALADPTRLRILRSLGQAPATPSELARELRLRPPTVVHHLQQLRGARLVQPLLDDSGQRLYGATPGRVAALAALLEHFLGRGRESADTD